MKNRKYQKGQAIAEMTAGLISIMAVFFGLFLIMELSISNVDNILEARGQADIATYNGVEGDMGTSIRFWEEGTDTLLYTADDEAQIGTSDNGETFVSELGNEEFSLATGLSGEYVENNFTADLEESSLFISAADMTSATESSTVSLDDAERVLFFDSGDISLTDTVYMPFIMETD